jgi:LexA DNA binding domain
LASDWPIRGDAFFQENPMKNNLPTPRQLRVLFAIIQRQHCGEHVTLKYLNDTLGIRSANGVLCHLKPLQKKGFVTRNQELSGKHPAGALRSLYRLELFPEAFSNDPAANR